MNDVQHFLFIPVFIKEYIAHAARQKIEQDADQLSGIDRAPKSRKTDLKARRNGICPDLTGRAGQDLLPRAAGCDQAALAGAFGFKIKARDLARKAAQKVILQGGFLKALIEIFGRKAGGLMAYGYADLGRGGKGIPLHMVNG